MNTHLLDELVSKGSSLSKSVTDIREHLRKFDWIEKRSLNTAADKSNDQFIAFFKEITALKRAERIISAKEAAKRLKTIAEVLKNTGIKDLIKTLTCEKKVARNHRDKSAGFVKSIFKFFSSCTNDKKQIIGRPNRIVIV